MHECSQGKRCEACRLETVACLMGLLSWLSAPLRWMRSIWPVVLVVFGLNLLVAFAVTQTLYRTAQVVSVIRTQGLVCYSYAPSLWNTVYFVARCTKEPETGK